MNGEILLNTYTIFVVAIIALLLWLAISFLKKPKGVAKLLTQSQENLTGLGAFMMALCSIGLSIGFSLSLATSIFIGILFVSLFTGFCIAEFTASFHLAKAWTDGRLGRVAAAVFLLIGGATISIIAGQALIATKVDEAQAERLQASEAYQLALNERKSAQAQVKSLAMDGSIVAQAKDKLAQFEATIATLQMKRNQAQTQLNACPPSYLTKCINPLKSEIASIDDKIAVLNGGIEKEQAILAQFKQYQSAKSYSDNLAGQTLPPSVVTDSALPGIKALSIVLGIPAEVIGAHVFLFLAIFGEIGGIILFYLWGASRLERAILIAPGGITFDGEFTSSHHHSNNQPSNSYLTELTTTINQLQQKLTELEHSKKE
jgi:uncharacterized protein (DUF1330 family)